VCHKCEHNGKFKGVAYEKTPCASCQIVDRTDVVGYEDNVASPCARAFDEDALSESMPVRVLADALNIFVGLTVREFEIVRLRFRGETLPDIAATLGVGVFEIRFQLRKLLRKAPVLRKLLPVTYTRKGPKPKADRGRR
jgi:DNA-binding CsgD family transcriptional regulator